MRPAFLSSEILVEDPSILEDLTGALMVVQRDSIDCRLSAHSVEPDEPAVKKSSR